MQLETPINNFNKTIDLWINALTAYQEKQLHVQPSPQSWSIGQLYLHLLGDTQYYIEEMKICMHSNAHAEKLASDFAIKLFLQNDFPDEKIEGAASNASIPQPDNKAALLAGLLHIKNEMNRLGTLIFAADYPGKSKHPGLGYFSAAEWFQFAEIHFRHHLRQKKRIDDYLSKLKIANL